MKMVHNVLFSVLLVSGCSTIKSPTFWDATKEVCKVALAASPEVQEEAKTRKLTGNEWAGFLCNLSDVIEQFAVDDDPKKATERALFFTRARGLTREK